MSMDPRAVLAGSQQSGFAGTDIIQLSDIQQSKNRYDVPLNGAKCIFLDNQSGAQLLVTVNYPVGVGNIDIILNPWDSAPLVFDTEIDSITIVNLTVGPVPTGFSVISRLPTTVGYVAIAAIADPSDLQKSGINDAQSPAWYRCSGLVSVPANSTSWLIGGSGVGIELINVTVLDLWNLDSSNNASFTWWTGPKVISTGALPLSLPTGGTVDTGNPAITLPPGSFLSMDVDTRNRGNFYCQASNAAASPVTVQALVRGM